MNPTEICKIMVPSKVMHLILGMFIKIDLRNFCSVKNCEADT